MKATAIKTLAVIPDEVLNRFTRQYRITSHSLKHAHGAIRVQPASALPMLDVDGLAFMAEDPGNPTSDEAQRMETEGWLLRAACIDLITALNESLIEACRIIRLSRTQRDSKLKPFLDEAAIEEHMSKIETDLMRAHIPDLLKELSNGMERPLAYEQEIRSLNQLRNCLIHRNGLVSKRDVNTTDVPALRLCYMSHKIYVREGEVEHEVDRELKARSPIINAMMTRPVPKTVDYPVGSVIGLTTDVFNDVAFTCYLFLGALRTDVYSALGSSPKALGPEVVLVGTAQGTKPIGD